MKKTTPTYPCLKVMPLSDLKPHPDGVRTATAESVFNLTRCYELLGLLRPPVVLNVTTGNVIDGDRMIEALRRAEVASVPVWCVEIPEEAEDAAHLALQNHAGEWQWEAVSKLLKKMKERNEPLELTGFHEYDTGPLVAADWTPPAKGPLDGSDAAQIGLFQ